MKFEIDISSEEVDSIVRLSLIESFENSKALYDELSAKAQSGEELSSVQMKDLESYERTVRSLRVIIEHYSTPDQYLEFIQEYDN